MFGILGLVMCGIFAPIAWIQGNQHIQRARILGVPPEGAATAGRILGIVGTVLIGLSLVAFGIMIAAGVFAIPVLHGG